MEKKSGDVKLKFKQKKKNVQHSNSTIQVFFWYSLSPIVLWIILLITNFHGYNMADRRSVFNRLHV